MKEIVLTVVHTDDRHATFLFQANQLERLIALPPDAELPTDIPCDNPSPRESRLFLRMVHNTMANAPQKARSDLMGCAGAVLSFYAVGACVTLSVFDTLAEYRSNAPRYMPDQCCPGDPLAA